MLIKTGDCSELPMCQDCNRRHAADVNCDGTVKTTSEKTDDKKPEIPEDK